MTILQRIIKAQKAYTKWCHKNNYLDPSYKIFTERQLIKEAIKYGLQRGGTEYYISVRKGKVLTNHKKPPTKMSSEPDKIFDTLMHEIAQWDDMEWRAGIQHAKEQKNKKKLR